MPSVIIDAGRRNGRTLSNEPRFREAIAAGSDVYTQLNNVWFSVTLNDDDQVIYTALTKRPDGV